ncbi:MAG: lipid A phosphoethanolamine transferase [Alistipes sp.]|nr:lipid A phosphoethanolamine transferase [Alistipes sp.]
MIRKTFLNPQLMAVALIASLMLPVVILTYTEHNPFWVALSALLLPLGFYTMLAALSRRSGAMTWWAFPFIFFSAFQVVLSYLFGNSVVAADMFLNLTTTNTGEAGELLANIYPSVIAVFVIYLPLLYLATQHIISKVQLKEKMRRRMLIGGAVTMLAGCITLFAGCRGEVRKTLRDEVFPINVAYNMGLAISEAHKIANFPTTSQGFTFEAERDTEPEEREIYVMVIGEAARAASWQMYDYERETNPLLSQRDDIVLFRQITTQSNTTHKSVPLMLSSVHTSEHEELFRRKGMPALFKEAGFKTYFISNQVPQGAMIDHLAGDSDVVEYLPALQHDYSTVEALRRIIREDQSKRLLIILHTYGSHFSYHQRYPREWARFTPEDDVAILRKNATLIRNAYDNSTLYTDYVLNSVIETLATENACTAMLYCADHGEDLFDDVHGRFLHASPTTTYYQLHVASLAWFSPRYRELFPVKAAAAKANAAAVATTHSVFHTMADVASIGSPYVLQGASLVSPHFDNSAKRYYLSDHNEAVELNEEIGIYGYQLSLIERAGVEL